MSSLRHSFLVTGGAGFIGANFLRHLRRSRSDCRIVVLDALTYAGNRQSIAPLEDGARFTFVHGDIRDQSLIEDLLRRHYIDTLVNFAAESHVDRSISGPDEFIATNIVGTHALLKAARAVWLSGTGHTEHRFHQVSTDEVFGSLGPEDAAFCESTAYAPNSPYAASKAAADHLVRAYGRTYHLNATISNCSNNYGPYQFPEKLIPLALTRVLAGEPVPIYGDGRNVRDWLYVEDHCLGIDAVLAHGRPGESYNIGGGTELSNLELIERLCAALARELAADPALAARFPACPAAHGASCLTLLKFVADRPGHDRRYAIDGRKIEAELGYRATVAIDAGLARTVRWYLNNEAWWRAGAAR